MRFLRHCFGFAALFGLVACSPTNPNHVNTFEFNFNSAHTARLYYEPFDQMDVAHEDFNVWSVGSCLRTVSKEARNMYPGRLFTNDERRFECLNDNNQIVATGMVDTVSRNVFYGLNTSINGAKDYPRAIAG